MTVSIFDGSRKDDGVLSVALGILTNEFQSCHHSVNLFTLRDMQIDPCMGCFDCWLKTPGMCIINDVGRSVTNKAVTSDIWVFLTPLTFGGYSSELKKAIDRLLPIFIPVFTKVNGERHHKLRYEKHPVLIGIGSSQHVSKDSDGTFARLIARNAINFRSPASMTAVFAKEDGAEHIRDRIVDMISKIESASE